MNHQKNNVHVSGILNKERVTENGVAVDISICEALQLKAVIEQCNWEKYKSQFPDTYQSVAISGMLQSERNINGLTYSIKAKSLGRFHNVLAETLDERQSLFCGLVRLKKKIDFDTSSKLFLKRLLFETISTHEKPVFLEAVALRGIVPYFDSIQEGAILILKANYVVDKNGNQPYWKINHVPELVSA